MTLYKIASIGEPILRQRAREITRDELLAPSCQTFIDDLVETMRDASGAGLAAIQIYQPIRIVAMEVGDNPRYPYKPKFPLTVLVNPVLTPLSAERFNNFEGCLSVPNLRGRVARFAELRVQGLDRLGEPIDKIVRGITAGTYQHEVDHLDGKLFIDSVEDPTSLCTWDAFRRYHEAAFREEVLAVVARWGS